MTLENRINPNFYVDTLGWYITDKCNLNCKLCVAEIPYKTNRIDFSNETMTKAMKQYFSLVGFTRKITVTGGEPMLHNELSDTIDAFMKYSNQFDILNIITNGRTLPTMDVLSVMESNKDKIVILIDDYGELSININNIITEFSKHGIAYEVRCYYGENAHCGGWVDYGDYSHKHSREEATLLYGRCSVPQKKKKNTGRFIDNQFNSGYVSLTFLQMNEGMLCHCQRAYNLLINKVITERNTEYISLLDNSTIDSLKKRLLVFSQTEYISACEYCNGLCDNSVRFIPAEQL